MEQPEAEWLAEYRRGDTEALGKLVEQYRRPLYGFIVKMTERHADADEVFQEVWFRAIRALDSFREDRLLSWLFRIAHNLIIDRARRAGRMVDLQPRDGDDLADAVQERLADRGPAPSALAAGRDLGERIRAAVARLPDDQRAVFLMRTQGDVPFKDIARAQGTNINTALARMQYALQKLRQELQGDYQDLGRGLP